MHHSWRKWKCLLSAHSLCTCDRQNPPGTISGKQLGEAAHRLVVNSLQLKTDRNGIEQMHRPPSSHVGMIAASPYYNNGRQHSQDQQTRMDYSRRERFGYPAVQSDSYGQLHPPSSTTHQQYGTSVHQQSRLPNQQYERSHWQNQPRGSIHGFSSTHQNGGYGNYQHGPAVQYAGHSGGGYNGYGSYQAYGASQWTQQYDGYGGGGWGHPPGNQNGGGRGIPPANHNGPSGGYAHSQPSRNRYSALDRGASQRAPPPPPPGYGRY